MSGALVGEVVGGCRVETLAGYGAMGVVYRAVQERLERTVALKVLAPELAVDAAFRERFEREARLTAAVEHPNVIPVYEAGELGSGELYLMMRWVEGGDLRRLLDREGRLGPARAVELLCPVASALHAAHLRGLVHRDVKPANILIEEGSGHVYLSDFGIARAAADVRTGTGGFLGTMAYAAPERFDGDPGGPRADIYSLGCVLFETLTGRRPFSRDSEVATMRAHLGDPIPSVRSVDPAIPFALDEVVHIALAKDPAARFQVAGEMAAALDDALVGRSVPRSSTPTAALAGDAVVRPGSAPAGDATVARPGSAPARDATVTRPASAPAPRFSGGRLRLALAALALAACGVVAGALLAGGGSSSGGETAAFRAAMARACRLGSADAAALPVRTRALNASLGAAATWTQSRGYVYAFGTQAESDLAAIDVALEQAAPARAADRALVAEASGVLKTTIGGYRTYLHAVAGASTPAQLARLVQAFQPPNQLPLRLATAQLSGRDCLAPAPPVAPVPLWSAAVMKSFTPARSHPTSPAAASSPPSSSGSGAGVSQASGRSASGPIPTQSAPVQQGPAVAPAPAPAAGPLVGSSGGSSGGAGVAHGGG